MNIKPIGNRILVEPLKIEEKTFSGIILPNSGEAASSDTGIVVALGNIEEEIAVGDKVFFRPHSGVEIPDSDKNFLILEMEEVLAVIG
ncbi:MULTISPECIES: co-chaperone GroES [Psychrilyobacter]|uniref:10 kDa chaperonin n=1 Tax=Psychrilyobacter piezotolerans TaxID=2293438 RepID=A0ABX9KEA9_9FUSO|nr:MULTISPECIES: co-chaperone GroES [Psychrilyobacter]MCS5422478.1 co-chaperone GroES [Psychrilyobacter sp. S5]NDI79020.1 co-chaperone GroES [Psychrilyobacter piezotolerans]RDE59103.1 co-chaperone GroES [Psychrilyobacter sp. S5]REI39674.1 co-chaperone GroES [Psychrilyobacter piezotolerans]